MPATIVHAGEMVSFEFNPVLDPISPSTHLPIRVNLDFARWAEDGVTLERPAAVFSARRNSAARISSIGNGFFPVWKPGFTGQLPGECTDIGWGTPSRLSCRNIGDAGQNRK